MRLSKPLREVRSIFGEDSMPVGVQLAEIKSIGQRESNKKGTVYHTILFENDAGKLSDKLYVTSESEWRVKELLTACGYDADTVPQDFDEQLLEGTEIEIDVREEMGYKKIKRYSMPKGIVPRAWGHSVGDDIPVQQVAEPDSPAEPDISSEMADLPF